MRQRTIETKTDKPAGRLMNTEDQSSGENIVRMIIHEIRNPLSAISLANQLLAEESISLNKQEKEGVERLTEIIARNIMRIEKQLMELTDTSSWEQLSYRPVDICYVIDNVLVKTGDRTFLKKVSVHKFYRDTYYIIGNEHKLSVAFLNIIVNAIEAMENEKGELWVSINDKGEEIEVIVRDNGKGMDPETATHIFDPNYSTKLKGLGMGLTHVKQIFDEHNVSISINTAPRKGTSFSVLFKK